jgi:hypothetical protein
MLADGKWTAEWHPVQAKDEKGGFVRQTSSFRNWVTPDGSAGPTGEGGFAAEAGRYHLYVALICPWASRTLIDRKLKKLDDVIHVRPGWQRRVPHRRSGGGGRPPECLQEFPPNELATPPHRTRHRQATAGGGIRGCLRMSGSLQLCGDDRRHRTASSRGCFDAAATVDGHHRRCRA